jgi:hypothetical protein
MEESMAGDEAGQPEQGQAPPPLAAMPPPLPPPVAPPRRSFPIGWIVAIVLALALATAAILFFTGVFDRAPVAPSAPAAPLGGAQGPSGSALPSAPAASVPAEPCLLVRSARAAAGMAIEHRPINRLAMDAGGAMRWNGAPVEGTQLRQYLDITATMNPEPFLIVDIAPGANPAAIAALTDSIERSMNCRFDPA